MRKILLIIAFFCLFFAVTAGGDFRKSGFSGGLEDAIESAFAGNDTIFIFHWNFYNGMPANVTEVGGVSVVSFGGSNVFKVDVVSGGSDYAQITIISTNEYRARIRFRITDADTSGWADSELIRVVVVRGSAGVNGEARLAIYRDSGQLKWILYHYDDVGGLTFTFGTVVVTDTWYNLEWHIKKSTAAGADNGICALKVNGTVVANKITWNNDATIYDEFYLGGTSSTLDAIYYIDDVKLWSPEGLP